MERSSLHFAQQASVSRFSDPREQERRQREQQIYAATRHRALNPPSRLNTGGASPSQQQQQQQQQQQVADVDLDWAGNVIHRRHRKRLDPAHKDTMGTVLTSAQIDDAKPFRKQFHAGGRDLRFSSYGAEAEGMPLNSAAYQLSAGEAHTASNWKSTTQASIMESGSAALDDDGPHRKPKGRRIVKPTFENAAARIAQTRNQDLLLGNRKNKSAGPTNFLDSIYKSVAASTSNIQRPSTDPGTFGNGLGFGGNVSGGKVGARNGFSLGGARTETIQDLDDQIQRASKFLSPAVYTAAKSSATSPRRQRQLEQARKQPALSHRIW